MTEWRLATMATDYDGLRLAGLDVWHERWRPTGLDPVMLSHPQYPHQQHVFDIYEIGDEAHPLRFAARELSMNAWAFYVPE